MASARLIHYDVHGDHGPFALLVHGFLSSRTQWLPNVDALSHWCRPVVAELLGHGRSPSPEDPAPYAPACYVAEFERIRESLGAERWIVIGQSLGAALTLRYALDRPRRFIAHVFTNSNSALAEDGWEERVRPGVEAQAARLRAEGRAAIDDHPLHPLRHKRLPADLRAAFEADAALLDPVGVANTGLYTVPPSSSRARIHENRVPSLLMFGKRETRFAPHARFAGENMPSLTVVRLDGGHAVNIDDPDGFNAAAREFCDRA